MTITPEEREALVEKVGFIRHFAGWPITSEQAEEMRDAADDVLDLLDRLTATPAPATAADDTEGLITKVRWILGGEDSDDALCNGAGDWHHVHSTKDGSLVLRVADVLRLADALAAAKEDTARLDRIAELEAELSALRADHTDTCEALAKALEAVRYWEALAQANAVTDTRITWYEQRNEQLREALAKARQVKGTTDG
jgi:hypothetical protein